MTDNLIMILFKLSKIQIFRQRFKQSMQFFGSHFTFVMKLLHILGECTDGCNTVLKRKSYSKFDENTVGLKVSCILLWQFNNYLDLFVCSLFCFLFSGK